MQSFFVIRASFLDVCNQAPGSIAWFVAGG
jgi:hypothetical protein